MGTLTMEQHERRVNLQQTLPFPTSQAQPQNLEEWARVLRLVRPAIKPSSTCPGILVHPDGKDRRDKSGNEQAVVRLGYVSALPTALVQGKVQAWAWAPDGDLGDHAAAVHRALEAEGAESPAGGGGVEVAVVVKKGVRRQGSEVRSTTGRACITLEGANDSEAELFVNVLFGIASSHHHASPDSVRETVRLLASRTGSVMALLTRPSPPKTSQSAAATLAPSAHVEYFGTPGSLTETWEMEISSIDELASRLLERSCRDSATLPSAPGDRGGSTRVVHATTLNGLSQLESWILLGSIRKARASLDGRSEADQTVGISALPYPHRPERGFGLATVILPDGFMMTRVPAKNRPADVVAPPTPPQTTEISEGLSPSRLVPPAPPQKPTPDSAAATTTAPSPVLSSSAFSPAAVLQARVRAGCEALIAAEPEITRFDTLTGDGDCGLTLSDGARRVLQVLPSLDLSSARAAGGGGGVTSSINRVVDELEGAMGGTSGVLYCIFLSELAAQLSHRPSARARTTASPQRERAGDAAEEDDDESLLFPVAMKKAMDHLFTFTRARPGDRTCIDVLEPLVSSLMAGSGREEACEAAERGAQATAHMRPNVGRATYLSADACDGVPDAGAWGLAAFLRGFCSV